MSAASSNDVLVFGKTGQLASELARAAWPADLRPRFLDRRQADLSRPDGLPALVAELAPRAIVIAAAYTAVDKAESEEDLARTVNAEGPAAIAAAAAETGTPVVYVSTDYVFDGTKDSAYVETDTVAPRSAYGRSKAAGEALVRAANPRHLILRTSWVVSPFGANFLKTMLRLARDRDVVSVVADQQGCPTSAADLAGAAVLGVERLLGAAPLTGTFHAAGAEATTWHGFAEGIFAELVRHGMKRPENRAIPGRDYPVPAPRPANSRLSSARFAAEFGYTLPGWQAWLPGMVAECLAEADRSA